MVTRIGLTIVLAMLLTGCSKEYIIKNEIQEVIVPVIYSPAPPVIERPVLPIHFISAEQLKNDGEVAKHYKATVKTLINYSMELEEALLEYSKINKAYEKERQNVELGIKTTE